MSDYTDFGVVFRVDDLNDGSFYIGETTSKKKWENGYKGTGSDKWQNHLKKHPDIIEDPDNPDAHSYKRTVIASGFTSKKELYTAELNEILKYSEYIDDSIRISDPLCKNVKTHIQGSYKPCSECGSLGIHKRTCSKFKDPGVCPECSGTYWNHKKLCSKYTKPDECPYCGSRTSHKIECKLYNRKNNKCTKDINCNGSYHYKECPKYNVKVCDECSGKNGHHYKFCTKYKSKSKCSECGSLNGSHLKSCSLYIPKGAICSECKGKTGHHKKYCSRYKEYRKCEECGGERGHFKYCSKYKRHQ